MVPSRRCARNASAALENFVCYPPKTFSTASTRKRHFAPTAGLAVQALARYTPLTVAVLDGPPGRILIWYIWRARYLTTWRGAPPPRPYRGQGYDRPRKIGPASIDRACRNLVPAFQQRSPPRLLTAAACGGLRSAPDCRTRRALLHLSYSCASPFGPATLVTHDPTRKSD